jgi:hypothetical protein
VLKTSKDSLPVGILNTKLNTNTKRGNSMPEIAGYKKGT